jgi:tRNA(adenine34) deaminase
MNENFLKLTIELAKQAAKKGEVPVGAVIVKDNKIIAQEFNQKETKADPTAHCEMICIQSAAKKLGKWRLTDCEIYVSLEPCAMCAGAIAAARLKSLFFSCLDPKMGGVISNLNILNDKSIHHKIKVDYGLFANESSQLLKDFFKQKRQQSKIKNNS